MYWLEIIGGVVLGLTILIGLMAIVLKMPPSAGHGAQGSFADNLPWTDGGGADWGGGDSGGHHGGGGD